MKHLLTLICLCALLIACAGGPAIQQEPLQHTLDITVSSATDAKIEVTEKPALTGDQRDGMGLGKLSQLSWMNDAKTKCFVKIFSGLSVADVTRLWNDVTWLEENTKVRQIELFINSPGGDAFSGLALSDIIAQARRKGFTINAHASGIIASAAVPVFAACSKRYAAPGTIFMVHEAALWKWPGRETASDIRSQNELMNLLRDKYLGFLCQRSKLTFEEWAQLERVTTWFSAEKAMNHYGLVDEIE
ncbi:MAG: ATP-dependent Clp protease proteolytic subunit [Planctomycetota bacterium]|jgi:ATP-dependent Clp protease protease subunit